jgi:hypothetical protein
LNNAIATQNDIPFFVSSTPATKTLAAALKKYEPSVVSSPNYGEAVTNSWVSGPPHTSGGKGGGCYSSYHGLTKDSDERALRAPWGNA